MEIREDRQQGVAVVAPVGRVDSTTSAALEQRLNALVGAGERRIVVDFGGVEYISSAGLRVMLALAKKTRDTRGALALCGFLPLFAVEPERAAAVARVAAS
jgi:anti-anti-sigma factor